MPVLFSSGPRGPRPLVARPPPGSSGAVEPPKPRRSRSGPVPRPPIKNTASCANINLLGKMLVSAFITVSCANLHVVGARGRTFVPSVLLLYTLRPSSASASGSSSVWGRALPLSSLWGASSAGVFGKNPKPPRCRGSGSSPGRQRWTAEPPAPTTRSLETSERRITSEAWGGGLGKRGTRTRVAFHVHLHVRRKRSLPLQQFSEGGVVPPLQHAAVRPQAGAEGLVRRLLSFTQLSSY